MLQIIKTARAIFSSTIRAHWGPILHVPTGQCSCAHCKVHFRMGSLQWCTYYRLATLQPRDEFGTKLTRVVYTSGRQYNSTADLKKTFEFPSKTQKSRKRLSKNF